MENFLSQECSSCSRVVDLRGHPETTQIQSLLEYPPSLLERALVPWLPWHARS